MQGFWIRFLRLIIGLFLYALGIVVTIKANIGYAPWEIFHVGLSMHLNITIGTASIIVGLIITAIVMIFKERVGIGTILNMLLIGIFIDVIMELNFIPLAGNLVVSVAMMLVGLFIIAVGSYFYIDSAFGAGPRDSLMVLLGRKTKLPIGLCRNIIEFSVALIGWLLGGMLGIGTVIPVFAMGIFLQIVFKAFKFDPKAVRHETILDTYARFIQKQL